MLAIRLTKTFMVAALAAFAGLVTIGNLVDYGSNYAFVQHVLSMDDTFPGNALAAARAITDPRLWQLGYGLIIAGEGLTALLFTIAAAAMLAGLRDGRRFARAKAWAVVAAGAGFAVWFLGFMVVGGEYFAMWQSHTWNGQEPAFRFYMTMLAVIIFVSQAEPVEPG
ncbi:DUF2165 family protein [Ancylobacter lacus]|uniref:DUF2165 family protein n=1 Tax=Ancylobacter lacus TaxID=2579970 RepID=UPI001BCFC463|nr:DUF2165 domain-containing protein [Ancylobacter lacus]MBS7540414.1 DUF2165 domain-containing protein [Ancylobacter lacus]